MAKTVALLLLFLQLITFTALAEELKAEFDKPDRFRLPFFSPRVPVEINPIMFNPVNDPIITDPAVSTLDPNAPPATFKPRSPVKRAPIRHTPVKPPVRFDPVNPLGLSTPPPPV